MITGTYQKVAILDARNGIHLESFGDRKTLAEHAVGSLGLEFNSPEEYVAWAERLVERLRADVLSRLAPASEAPNA